MKSHVFSPITDREMLVIAENMLRKVKLICPRFSMPSDAEDRALLVEMWANALGARVVYPRVVYDKAFELFSSSAGRDDNPPMPGDILRHCRFAIERIEVDPVLGPKLHEWRAQRFAEREQRFM